MTDYLYPPSDPPGLEDNTDKPGEETVNLWELDEVKDELVKRMKEKFPEGHYSVLLSIWDDHTYRIQCRHGESIGNGLIDIHIWQYYKDKYTYKVAYAKDPESEGWNMMNEPY